MTTIVAYIEPDTARTWIGADSRATQGDHFTVPTSVQKLLNIGQWWIAVAGNWGANALISRNAAAIEAAANDPYAVVDAVQGLFKEADWHRCTEHSGAPCYEQYWALVRRGQIFSVSGSGSLVEISGGFWAEGSGREYALGVMAALAPLSPDPIKTVQAALGIASRYDLATGEPFFVREVE